MSLFGALLIFLLAACGGSGSGSTSSRKEGSGSNESRATAASKKIFVEKADALCRAVPEHYAKLLSALELELGKKPSRSEELLRAAVPPLQTALGELRQLPPPKVDEDKAKAMVEALEAGVEGLEKNPNSKLRGFTSPLNEFTNLARAYGAEDCGLL